MRNLRWGTDSIILRRRGYHRLVGVDIIRGIGRGLSVVVGLGVVVVGLGAVVVGLGIVVVVGLGIIIVGLGWR